MPIITTILNINTYKERKKEKVGSKQRKIERKKGEKYISV